jgi:competence protein ComEC
MLALSFASLCASAVWPTLGVVFNNTNWCFSKGLLCVLHFMLSLPGGLSFVGRPHFPAPKCELTVFDLGNGGATHVRAEGADWLLDCGQGYDYRSVVLPYLRSRGVNGLDGLVLTHGSAPHIGAASSVLEDLHPQIVVDSALKDRSRLHREFQATLEKKETGRRIVTRGDVIEMGPDARFRVLFPPAGWEKSAADDKAIVLLLEAGGERVLFTFDSGFSTEEWLLRNEPDLRADLLVKGLHSKDLSGTPDFLARVRPQVIICAPPRLGASTNLDEWAEEVRQSGCALFRQDQTGAVQVTIRNGQFRAEGFANGQAFRSRTR